MESRSNNKNGLMFYIIGLWTYLGKGRVFQILGIIFLMLLVVAAEIISIGAIIPFLTALTDPQSIFDMERLQPVFEYFGIVKADELLFPLTIAFVTSALIAACLRLTLLWANSRLTVSMGVQLRTEIYSRVLYESYEYHVNTNSSHLISLATEKVIAAINSGIMQTLLLLSSLVVSISILVTLFFVDTVVALTAFFVLGGGYILTGYLLKKKISVNSKTVSINQPKAVRCMQEGIGGIRDVIMDGSQEIFKKLYIKTSYDLQKAQTQNILFGSLPKPILELIGIVMIVSLAYWLETRGGNSNSLPILGALALGAQRMLPALQQVYFSWSAINGNKDVIGDIVNHLRSNHHTPLVGRTEQEEKITFEKELSLDNLSFSYHQGDKEILKAVNLSIPKAASVGVIGQTGSGKSTLLDIIMGLLSPTGGSLRVDDAEINIHNVKNWQSKIAHVPQVIFLSDATLMENIAFGVSAENIDLERVKRAANMAHISEYIEMLPEGYRTQVGERGVRLSGGQRQRIGIARALYKDAELIVFDEATSALDSDTEQQVMSSIEELNKDLTIVIIAHRLTTLKDCDFLVRFENGVLVEQGTYEELILET